MAARRAARARFLPVSTVGVSPAAFDVPTGPATTLDHDGMQVAAALQGPRFPGTVPGPEVPVGSHLPGPLACGERCFKIGPAALSTSHTAELITNGVALVKLSNTDRGPDHLI